MVKVHILKVRRQGASKPMRSSRRTIRGFTLVEVLIASTITGFIALVAVGALKAITASAERIDESINRTSEIRFAATTLQRDLLNLYRDQTQENTEFIAMGEDATDGGSSYLLFYTVSRAKARLEEPEGEIYEVEYYLQHEDEKSCLMRRMWPNPDKETMEPGGILMVIAEDVEIFQVRFFDGEEWSLEWPEEMETLPHLLEATIVAKQTKPGMPAVETFLLNIERAVGSELTDSEDTGQADSAATGQM